MQLWRRITSRSRQQQARMSLPRVAGAMTLAMVIISGCAASGESDATSEPRERWKFTTKFHFSLYGLLLFAPIYRDQIRSVLLDSERVYLAVSLGQSGLFFTPAEELNFLALDRDRGSLVWTLRLPFKGYPIGEKLILTKSRLVAALFEKEKKELVIIGIDLKNGQPAWRVHLPPAKGPAMMGHESIVIADRDKEHVVINVFENKGRRQITLRATDGVKLGETYYPGYVWRSGPLRTGDLTLGYEGYPSGWGQGKNDRLLAFREQSGELVWSFPFPPLGNSFPALFKDSVLVANGQELLCINVRSGQLRWKVKLDGRIPPDADPPLVIGSRVAVGHDATPDPEAQRWKLSFRRLSDGAKDAEVSVGYGDVYSPSVLKRIGDLVIVGDTDALQVIDTRGPTVVTTINVRKLLSWFVFVDSLSMSVAGSDEKGFLLTTMDGQLRYYAADDFRVSGAKFGPSAQPQRTASATESVLSVLFYLVVNPLWDILQLGRRAFWVWFYSSPFVALGLIWFRKPFRAWLGRMGIWRGAAWGALVGMSLSVPAAVYRGLLGGMAAGIGTYGAFGPSWGAVAGFSYFLGLGCGLGGLIGSLISLVWRRGR